MTSAVFEPTPISSETKQTRETPQTSTKTDTIKTRDVVIGAVKEVSMVIYDTVFQALINIVEALYMDQDNAIVKLENLRIENIQMKSNLTNNVQIVQNYQYRLDNLENETYTIQYKVTDIVLDFSKDNMALQVKLSKQISSELVNVGIYQEDLVRHLCENKHDVHDLMGRLSSV